MADDNDYDCDFDNEDEGTSEMPDIGYLLLEDCEVVVKDGSARKPLGASKWIGCHLNSAAPSGDHDDGDNDEDCSKPEFCHRGDLMIHREADTGRCIIDRVPRFDGTTADLFHTQLICGPSCKQRGNRSDASLMVGLAIACQDIGHINITSCRIMLRTVEGDRPLSNNSGNVPVTKTRAALLLTFSGLTGEMLGVLDGHGKERRITKPLPPCTQLLLSLLRCDWETLDRTLQQLKAPIRLDDNMLHSFGPDGKVRRQRVSFFPPKMTLEEVSETGYCRSGVWFGLV